MFERYTERARRVIFFSRYEASQCGSPYIEPEHLLLGLIREERILTYKLLTPEAVEHIRSTVISRAAHRKKISTSVDLALSSESKQVLSDAAEQADRLSDPYIGTGHLLLGLLSQKFASLAVELLIQSGVTTQRAEQASQEINFDRTWQPRTFKGQGSGLEFLGPKMGFECYNEKARRTLFVARYEALRLNSPHIEPEHLLLGLMREDEILQAVWLKPADAGKIRSTIESSHKDLQRTSTATELPLTSECKTLLEHAAKQAHRFSHEYIGTEHLLLALLSQKSLASELLLQCGVTIERILMCFKKPPAAVRPRLHRSSSFPGAWPDAT